MSIATEGCLVEQIGESAGIVWRVLDTKGPLGMTKLVKESGLHKDLVTYALGWLAREDKICVDSDRLRTVSLKSESTKA
jgi:hypothetical protein